LIPYEIWKIVVILAAFFQQQTVITEFQMNENFRDLSRQPVLSSGVDSTVFVTEPLNTGDFRGWRTPLTSFNADEETCWWGNWFPALLHGRNAQTFEADTSYTQITYYVIYVVGCNLLLFYSLGWGFLFFVFGGLFITYQRAKIRGSVRQRLNVYGTFCDDFCTHLCCSPCAICQEAREGKMMRPRPLDFCTGEELYIQEQHYMRDTGHGRRGTRDSPADVS
jgi:Cys-rich protein (TIGR01571 family)